MRNPNTANQGPDTISLSSQWPSHGNLDQREGKDDECLHQVATSLLRPRQGTCTHEADLLREVAHDGQQTGGIDGVGEVVQVRAHVAEAVALEPLLNIVIPPDQGVNNGLEVLELNAEDKDDRSKLAVAVKQPHGDKADEVGDDGEEDAADQVCHQGGSSVRSFSRSSDDYGVTAVTGI